MLVFKPKLTCLLKGAIYLPEDKPGAFSLFVDWIYRRKVPAGNSDLFLANLYDLWLFATKICHTKLADDAMDQIQDTCHKYDKFASDEFTKEMWPLTENNAAMRHWVIDLKIHQIYLNKEKIPEFPGRFDYLKNDNFGGVWNLIKDDFELFKKFMDEFQHMTQCREKAMRDPRIRGSHDDRRCNYHSHAGDNFILSSVEDVSGSKEWVYDGIHRD